MLHSFSLSLLLLWLATATCSSPSLWVDSPPFSVLLHSNFESNPVYGLLDGLLMAQREGRMFRLHPSDIKWEIVHHWHDFLRHPDFPPPTQPCSTSHWTHRVDLGTALNYSRALSTTLLSHSEGSDWLIDTVNETLYYTSMTPLQLNANGKRVRQIHIDATKRKDNIVVISRGTKDEWDSLVKFVDGCHYMLHTLECVPHTDWSLWWTNVHQTVHELEQKRLNHTYLEQILTFDRYPHLDGWFFQLSPWTWTRTAPVHVHDIQVRLSVVRMSDRHVWIASQPRDTPLYAPIDMQTRVHVAMLETQRFSSTKDSISYWCGAALGFTVMFILPIYLIVSQCKKMGGWAGNQPTHHTSLLSRPAILAKKTQGHIVICPFRKANLGTSSYDITLGQWYFRCGGDKRPEDYDPASHTVLPGRCETIRPFNIYNAQHVAQYFGEPQQAVKAKVWAKKYNVNLETVLGPGIRPNDRIIWLFPGETILAHSDEFIGGQVDVTTKLFARSSMGRCSVTACRDAGMGDCGYINRWTLEVQNCHRDFVVPLVVGRRIGQIVFFGTAPILDEAYWVKGKYQSARTVDDCITQWKPHDMLPRLDLDREIQESPSQEGKED